MFNVPIRLPEHNGMESMTNYITLPNGIKLNKSLFDDEKQFNIIKAIVEDPESSITPTDWNEFIETLKEEAVEYSDKILAEHLTKILYNANIRSKNYIELPNGVKFTMKQFKNKKAFVAFKQFMNKMDYTSLDPEIWDNYCKFTIKRHGSLQPEIFMKSILEALELYSKNHFEEINIKSINK